MLNKYLKQFISQFIKFIVPSGSNYSIIDDKNKESFFTKQPKKDYDYIILFNVLEKENDIQSLLDKVYVHLSNKGRLIIIYRNYLQSFFTGLIRSFYQTKPNQDNWLATSDIAHFLELSDFTQIIQQPLCLTAVYLPLVSAFLNRLLLYFFPFNHLSFLQYIIACKKQTTIVDRSVTIVIPCRNEAGNIERLFRELPVVGKEEEIIFVEGHSKDNTREEIKRCIKKYANTLPVNFKLIEQKKDSGKANAVNLGFAKATGDILIIYDADMSIKATEIVKFYMALITNKGELINGSRLVYPIQGESMEFLNILGNKFFSLVYSWLLGQTIKDTLCGTKVLWRDDYQKIIRDKDFFGKFDPFGDFDLLLGASKLNLKILDLPVRYFKRTYGATNIKRFQNGLELAKFSVIAVKKLKMRIP